MWLPWRQVSSDNVVLKCIVERNRPTIWRTGPEVLWWKWFPRFCYRTSNFYMFWARTLDEWSVELGTFFGWNGGREHEIAWDTTNCDNIEMKLLIPNLYISIIYDAPDIFLLYLFSMPTNDQLKDWNKPGWLYSMWQYSCYLTWKESAY